MSQSGLQNSNSQTLPAVGAAQPLLALRDAVDDGVIGPAGGVERGGWEAAAQMVALAAAVGAGGGWCGGGGVRGGAPVRADHSGATDAPAWHSDAGAAANANPDFHSPAAATHHDADTGDVYAYTARTANDHARDSDSRLGCL